MPRPKLNWSFLQVENGKDISNLHLVESKEKDLSYTLSTRVSAQTFEEFTELTKEWGLSQSETLRKIVGAFSNIYGIEKLLKIMDDQETDNSYVNKMLSNGDITIFLANFGDNWRILSQLRAEEFEALSELEARINRMRRALEKLKKYLDENPTNFPKGGDETTEKP